MPFRNEITSGNFISRTIEFEQREREYLVPPAKAGQWHRNWIDERLKWYVCFGIRESNLRVRPHKVDVRRLSSAPDAARLGDRNAALTDPVAFYGFQLAPDVLIISEETGGWQGWFENRAGPLIEKGIRVHHLHNPFGLHHVKVRGEPVMHIDQFDLSYCMPEAEPWLTDSAAFAQVVQNVHGRGGTVQAYVGSPLAVNRSPQDTYLPRCSPGSAVLSFKLRILRQLGLCGSPFLSGCRCWDRLVRFHIDRLIDAKVDAIGFDVSFDFHPGDCMDLLVRSLLVRGIEVMIEPWPRKKRAYPPVSWIIREVLYQRIQLNPEDDEAPLDSVAGRIYRIVPSDDNDAGRAELDRINEIRSNHNQPELETSQDVVNAVRLAGHIPMVRAGQLLSGDVS